MKLKWLRILTSLNLLIMITNTFKKLLIAIRNVILKSIMMINQLYMKKCLIYRAIRWARLWKFRYFFKHCLLFTLDIISITILLCSKNLLKKLLKCLNLIIKDILIFYSAIFIFIINNCINPEVHWNFSASTFFKTTFFFILIFSELYEAYRTSCLH